PVPYFSPAVDIYETEGELTLLADMPGVESSGVEIDLKDNVLTLQGHASQTGAEGMTPVYREYREGGYYRQFVLSEIVDQEKISAEMSGGVLRVSLPKVSTAKPRRIEVRQA
ncbi:MAG: Hsp20/alpha crystallin family protein, partial [Thermodesulfobacteriota bacterium]